MRFPYKFSSLLLLPLLAAPLRAGEINFVYPAEGASIPDVPKTFVFGNISPASMPFTINGEKINVYSNGGFLAYLPINSGDFAFTGLLSDGTSVQRHLKVKGLPRPKSDDDEVWLSLNSVYSDIEVMPGDPVKIQASGAPGKEAVFSIEGLVSDSPMAETPQGSGHYTGVYWTKLSDAGLEGVVSTRFMTGLFRSDAETASRGRVRVLKAPYVVETTTDTAILRNASDGGYMMFLPKGVKLIADGRAGGQRRIYLSPSDSGWIDDAKVQPVNGGQQPIPPFTETGSIRTKKTDYGSQVTVGLYEKVPYMLEETESGARLTLYYTSQHTNWVVYDSSDTFVKNVVFRQAGTNTVEVDVKTDGPLWGYNVTYNGGKAIQLELRRKPALALAWPKPLAGLSVVLDPGHSPKYTSPYDGAIGPKATYEFQANMAIALKLREKLLTLGASVQMTRNGDETVSLPDRPKIAKELNGDIFLSIHNNALGDGDDPFAAPRGFQVYYYYPHSRALAEAVHDRYVRNIPLPDEGLRYGDYLVVRQTWMPAILTESAYMIIPQQEEMLYTPAAQERFAQSQAEGVLEFFKVPPEPARKQAARSKPAPVQVKPRPAPAKAAAVEKPVKAKKVKNVRHP